MAETARLLCSVFKARIGLAIMLLPGLVAADSPGAHATADEASALELSQAAIGRRLGNHHFIDRHGQGLDLDRLRGKPLVVSLVYTSCAHTCPVLTSHLADVAEIARAALGEDSFAMLTLGFDAANDTPARMASFARERGIDRPGWHFVSADPATVDAFARELGFAFAPSAGGFEHLAQTTVVDRDGRVYAQVYGQAFGTPSLVEPLKQLVLGIRPEAGRLGRWLDGVRLFCTVYDPASGRYRFDWSIFIAAGAGLVSLGGVAVFIVRALRQRGTPAARA